MKWKDEMLRLLRRVTCVDMDPEEIRLEPNIFLPVKIATVFLKN